MSVAKHDIAQRVSYVSNVSGTKDGDYVDAKTPETIEGGALREGGAPKLLSKDYIGVLAQYAGVGLIDAVLPATIYPFLQVYLQVSGTTYLTAATLVQLPWSFKFFYGVLSDCVPIMGYRRRPWMLVGWAIAIAMLLVMGFMPMEDPFWTDPSYLNLDPDDDKEAYEAALALANTDAPNSGGKYVVLMMLSAFGYLLSDVCADGVVVELAQREPLAVRGTTQSAIYSTRTLFNIFGYLITGFAFNGEEYGGDFNFSLSFPTLMLIIGIVMLPILPSTWYFIKEDKREAVVFTEYMSELWRVVQTRAVYQIMFYQFFAGMFSSITTTASSPIQSVLINVTPINSVLSSILGSLTFMIGIAVTGKYGLHWSWRKMIVFTGLLVILFDGITTFITVWDVFRSQWFWLGLPIAYQLPYGVNFIIGTFCIVEIANDGHEGAMYGLLTTVSNLSSPFAATLTKIIDRNWDLSNETIKADSTDTRWDITYTILIMYGSSVVSWAFLYFLPPQKEACQELKRTGGSSKLLGSLTLLYVVFAFVWSVSTNLMGIFESTSCLIIAGGNGC